MSLSLTRPGITDTVDLNAFLKQQVPSIDHISYEPSTGKCTIYVTGGTPSSSVSTLIASALAAYVNASSTTLFAPATGTGSVVKLDAIERFTAAASLISISSDITLGGHVITGSGPPSAATDLCRRSYVDAIGPGAGLSQVNQVFSVVLDSSTLHFDSGNHIAVNNTLTNVNQVGTLTSLSVTGLLTASSGLNAQGSRIVSIGDPSADTDAVNRRTLSTAISTLPGSGLVLTNGILAVRIDGASLSINPSGQIALATAQPSVTSLGTQSQLTVSGQATFQSTTDSTDVSNGAVQIRGGVGVAGSVNIGGNLSASGSFSAGQGLTASGIASFLSTVDSGSPSTGAVQVKGGLGVIGSVNIGGNLSASGSFSAGQGLTASGIAAFLSTVDSGSPSTGAVQVKGGLGVIGSVNIGGGLYIGTGINVNGKVIANVADPVSVADGANKRYVDSLTSTAGSGLVKTGTSFSVNVDGSSIELRGDGKLRLASGIVGAGLSGGSGTPLSVNAAQPGITSVGSLTSLTVTGALTVGSSGTLNSLTVTSGVSVGGTIAITGSSSLAGGLSIPLTTDATALGVGAAVVAGGLSVAKSVQIGGILAMNSQKIVNLGTPTAANDAASKGYVDNVTNFLAGSGLGKINGTLSVLVDNTSIEVSSSDNTIRVASGIAGTGLSGGSGTPLSVNAYQPQIVTTGTLTALRVTGATILSSTLAVTGATTLGGLTAGSSTLGATTIGAITGTTASFSSTLSVTGASTLGATTIGAITGSSASFSTTLSVTGNTTLGPLTAGASTLGASTIGAITGSSASFSTTLSVTGNTTLGLLTAGASTLGAATIGAITGTSANFSSTLSVTGASTLGAATIGAITGTSATFSTTLTVTGNTTLGLLTAGASTLGATTIGAINGSSASFSGTLSVTGNTTLGLLTAGASTLGAATIGAITGTSATFSTTLTVTGASTLGAATIGAITGSSASFSGTLFVTGNTTLGLLTAGASTLGATTIGAITGTSANFSTTISVTGATTLGLLSAGAITGTSATLSSTLSVTGNTTLGPLSAGASTLGATSIGVITGTSATFSNTLSVTGASTLGATTIGAITGSSATFSSTLSVTGSTTLGNLSAGASTLGATTIGGITGTSATFSSTLSVTGNTTLGPLSAGASTLGTVTGTAASFSGNVTVSGSTTLNSVIVSSVSLTGPYSQASSTFVDSVTPGAGLLANWSYHSVAVPTLAASNSGVRTTNASTIYIAGAPIAGTNETITNAYALHVGGAGATLLGGSLNVTGSTILAALSGASGTFSGTLGVSGTSTLGSLAATSGTFSGSLGVTGATTLGVLTAGASTLGVITGSSAIFSGTLGVTGALTGTTATFSSPVTTTNVGLAALQPALVVGNSVNLVLGLAYTTNQAGGLAFNYVASNSTSNNVRLGMINQAAGLTLLGTGGVNVESTLQLTASVNPTTSSGGALNVAGDLVLAANNPRVYFPPSGTGPPTLTSRSVGAKLVLFPQQSPALTDIAIGVDVLTLWYGVGGNTASSTHRWYGGPVNVMTLDGLGNLTVMGAFAISGSRSGTPATTGGQFLSISPATFTDTATAASGTLSNFYANYIGQPTLAAGNTGVTTGNASTLYIAGAPLVGANETISATNRFALTIASGITRLLDATDASATTASLFLSGGLTVQKTLFLGSTLSGSSTPATGKWIHVAPSTFTDSSTAASSTASAFVANHMSQTTLAAANTAVTTTSASTLNIAGPPLAGTNVTITTPLSLNVATGNSSFNGAVSVLGNANLLGPQIALPNGMVMYTMSSVIDNTSGTSLRLRMTDTTAPDCRMSLGNINMTTSYYSRLGLYCLNTAESSVNYERLELAAGSTGGSIFWTAAGTGVARNLTIYNTMTYTPAGLVSVSNTQEATSSTVASVTTAGGLGVAKSLKLGGSYSAAGQPAFAACSLSNSAAIAVGTETSVVFDTIVVDQTNSWAAPYYTAPEAGLYCVNLSIGLAQLGLAIDLIVRIKVTTTSTAATRSYIIHRVNPTASGGGGEFTGAGSIMTPLAAGDTVQATITVSGGVSSAIQVGSAVNTRNNLSIYKIA